MRAMVFDRYGPPEVLDLAELPAPGPSANAALVRVAAASVNDWDYELLHGRPFVNRMMFGLRKPKIRILGGDIAGRVEAVGDGVTAVKPGDEVYGDLCMAGFGAFADYVWAPESCLRRKPASMTFEQAAAIPQAGMLAVQGLLDAGDVQAGQAVLINGAGGGVGTFAVQLAKLKGAEVTVVDRRDKLDGLVELGADHAIDYQATDFSRGEARYDLILDPKTSRSPFANARALKPGGVYVTVGGEMPRLFETLALGWTVSMFGGKRVRIVSLRPNKDLDNISELFEAGRLAPVLDRTFALADTPDALRRFGRSDHVGKIIITMNQGAAS